MSLSLGLPLRLLVPLLAGQATGFRARREVHRPPSKAQPGAEELPPLEERGVVEELYTWGAPMVSTDPLLNPRSEDGCFKGLRMLNVNNEHLVHSVDPVPALFRLFGYYHPHIKVVKLDQHLQANEMECGWMGRTPETLDVALHMPHLYAERWSQQVWDGYVANISGMVVDPSYWSDPEQVAQHILPYGWNLVGTSLYRKKVSHLIQDPRSLDCILTFQGSVGILDWWDNVQWADAPYCGLDNKVHQGFRSQVRWVTQSQVWQAEIRRKLPFCRNVIVGGQSLGGAMASLFAACVAQAPTEGFAYEYDYKYLWWKKDVPKLLDPIV